MAVATLLCVHCSRPAPASPSDARGVPRASPGAPVPGCVSCDVSRLVDSDAPSVPASQPVLPGGTTLSGPCVAPARLAMAPGVSLDSNDIDLDGDGMPDFVVFEGAVRAQSTYSLYLRRGSCGYYVGRVSVVQTLSALPSRSHGLRDLRATSDECPLAGRMEYCEIIWRFDGRGYAVDSERRLTGEHCPPEVVCGDAFQ